MSLWLQIRSRRWLSRTSSLEGDDLRLHLLSVIRKVMILAFIVWGWSDLGLHLLKVMILGFICWVWSGRWWSWLSSFYGDPEDDDLGIHLSMEIRRMILGFIFRWYLEDDDLGLRPLRETQKMIILGFIFWGWSGRWWSWASSFEWDREDDDHWASSFWWWSGKWWSWASSFEGDPEDDGLGLHLFEVDPGDNDLWLHLLKVIRKMMVSGFIFLRVIRKMMILGFIFWRWWS